MAWVLLRVGEEYSNFSGHREWQLDSAEDINNPPVEATKCAPGSKAWLPDFTHIWNMDNNGNWIDLMGSHD